MLFMLAPVLLALGAIPLASGQLVSLTILGPGQTIPKPTSTALSSSTSSSLSSSTASSTLSSSSSSSSSSSTTKNTATTTYDPLVLNTVFTQPTDCITGITEIAAWSTELWQNVVNPAPGLTTSSCYPSQLLYSAVATSVLPPFKELVCPLNWENYQINSTYVICCPSGYMLFAPRWKSTVRPGLGAVCYTTIWPSVLMDITSYDSRGRVMTIYTSADDEGTQVFATAFEGSMAAFTASAPNTTASITPASTAPASMSYMSTTSSPAASSTSSKVSSSTILAPSFPTLVSYVTLAVSIVLLSHLM